MARPGTQLFTNTASPVSFKQTSANVVQFTFPQAPMGTTMTGSIFPVLKVPNRAVFNIGESSLNNAGNLNQVVWTLLRNGVPEISWNAYDTLQDVQVQFGETISVIAACSDNQINLLNWSLNYKGWAENSTTAGAVAPAILAATGNQNFSVQCASTTVAGVTNSIATDVLLSTGVTNPFFIKSIQMSMSVSTSNATPSVCVGWVEDTGAGPNQLCQMNTLTSSATLTNDTTNVECHDYELAGNLRVNFQSFDAFLSFGRVTASVFYSQQG